MRQKPDKSGTAGHAVGHAMRALGLSVLIFCMFLQTAHAEELEWPVWSLDAGEDASVHAQAAVVMDADTGAVLYENDAYSAYYPASITKIMTCLLALENCSLDETVTFSEDSIYNTEGSSIARDVGEEMSLEDCLYGMMLASANECAYAIGEHVAGGSIDDFVDMMNEKAAELGCTNTHFANSSGLPDEDHYVSAYDMALIAKAAYENETFRTIVGTVYYEIAPTNKHDEITYLMNHHNMLCAYSTTKYLKDYCLGGKTGYTQAARNTLVTYAEQDGMTLICVVLSAETGYHYLDTISLLEYYFEACESQSVTVETDTEDLFFETDIAALQEYASFLEIDTDTLDVILPAGADAADVTYTVTAGGTGEAAASILLSYNGKEIGSVDISLTDFEVSSWAQKILAAAGTAVSDSAAFGISAETGAEDILVLAVLILLAVLVTVSVKLQQRREERNRDREKSLHDTDEEDDRPRSARKRRRKTGRRRRRR